MKIAIFPGTFDPWHDGHADTVHQFEGVFDKIVIAQGVGPGKEVPALFNLTGVYACQIEKVFFKGFLTDFIKDLEKSGQKIDAVIRGLRNGADLQYEMNQKYWYRELGLQIPIFYSITDQKLSHISSSAIREINRIKRMS